MAILSDPTNRKVNPTALEDLDYDDFLPEAEVSKTVAVSYEIPPPPLGIMVTVHLDNKLKKIQDQKRNINLKIEYHQQLGDSFDYSNSDLHNVINIGRNAKTIIINKGEDQEDDAVTEQYLLLNRQSSRRSIPLIKNFIQDVFCIPKQSTRASNASSLAEHSEHLHLLPTNTRKKRIKLSKASFDNQLQRRKS